MKTVFVDVDTQFDFLYPGGALYVPHAERIVPAVAELNRYAARHGMTVVSTVDAHTEDDPEFRVWPHHCVAGAFGQRKPDATLLERRVFVPNRDCDLVLDGVQQVIVEKQTVDVFAAPNLSRVLYRLPADRYVVYGVVTEICVLSAARGLLKLGKPVAVLTNAIETLKPADSERALAEIRSLGGACIERSEVLRGAGSL
jgi:nicotinamidase/pyrazinamidase